MSKPKKTGFGKEAARKHYCLQCDKITAPVMRMPGRKMEYRCEFGHVSKKKETVLR